MWVRGNSSLQCSVSLAVLLGQTFAPCPLLSVVLQSHHPGNRRCQFNCWRRKENHFWEDYISCVPRTSHLQFSFFIILIIRRIRSWSTSQVSYRVVKLCLIRDVQKSRIPFHLFQEQERNISLGIHKLRADLWAVQELKAQSWGHAQLVQISVQSLLHSGNPCR